MKSKLGECLLSLQIFAERNKLRHCVLRPSLIKILHNIWLSLLKRYLKCPVQIFTHLIIYIYSNIYTSPLVARTLRLRLYRENSALMLRNWNRQRIQRICIKLYSYELHNYILYLYIRFILALPDGKRHGLPIHLYYIFYIFIRLYNLYVHSLYTDFT